MFSLLTSTRLTLPGSMNIWPISFICFFFFFFFRFRTFLFLILSAESIFSSPTYFSLLCFLCLSTSIASSFRRLSIWVLLSSLRLTAVWTNSWNLSSSSVGFFRLCLYFTNDFDMPFCALISASCMSRLLWSSSCSCSFWIWDKRWRLSLGSVVSFCVPTRVSGVSLAFMGDRLFTAVYGSSKDTSFFSVELRLPFLLPFALFLVSPLSALWLCELS